MNEKLREQIMDLLLGRLPPDRRATVLGEAAGDPEAVAYLESRSSLEAVLSSRPWTNRAIDGLEDERAWMELAAPEELMHSDGEHALVSGMFSDREWNDLVEQSLARAELESAEQADSPVPRGRLLRFPLWAKLAAAAAIVLFVPLGYHSLHKPSQRPDSAQSRSGKARPSPEELLAALAAQATAAPEGGVDTVDDFGGEALIAGEQQRMVRLADGTGALLREGSRMEAKEVHGEAAALSVISGSALFVVEANRSERFQVGTPVADVVVTGTAFSTTVADSNVLVMVARGSVEVTHRLRRHRLVLEAGESALAGPDTIGVVVLEGVQEKLSEQAAALRNALVEPQSTTRRPRRSDRAPAVPGQDVRALYGELRRRVLGSEVGVADEVEKFIADHPRSRFVEDILYDLGRMYEGQGRHDRALAVFDRLSSRPGSSRPLQSALYRRSAIYAEHKRELPVAADGFEEYLKKYPEGIWAEESMTHLLRIREILGDERDAQRLRELYLRRFADAVSAHEIAYQCAHSYRLVFQDYDKAIDHYDMVIESYPRSKYRGPAMYWAGWCLEEKGGHPEANRYFARYMREFPQGEWRRAIAESR
jgi:tetratricopeptide (TPR) repeat protein